MYAQLLVEVPDVTVLWPYVLFHDVKHILDLTHGVRSGSLYFILAKIQFDLQRPIETSFVYILDLRAKRCGFGIHSNRSKPVGSFWIFFRFSLIIFRELFWKPP